MPRAARKAEALRQRREERLRRARSQDEPMLIWVMSIVVLTVGLLLWLFFLFTAAVGEAPQARELWEGNGGPGLRHGVWLLVALVVLASLSAVAGLFLRFQRLARWVSALAMGAALLLAIWLFLAIPSA